MRSAQTEVNFRAGRGRSQLGARLRTARRSSLRRAVLEGLEPRTLLATLPAPQFFNPSTGKVSSLPTPIDASRLTGIEFQPSVAVDPGNSLHAVVAYTSFNPVNNPNTVSTIAGDYTNDGGRTWHAFTLPNLLGDPTTSNPTLPYRSNLVDGVGFDHSGNFYVLESQYSGAFSAAALPSATNVPASGAMVVAHYTFAGSSPSQPTSQTVYQYVPGGDPFLSPSLAVDAGVSSFTDPQTGAVQSDPYAGNVYVAWQTVNIAPAGATNFNPQRIMMVLSSDKGLSFSSPIPLDSGGDFGSQRYGEVQLAVSQGTADNRVPGGQVTATWVDKGSLATATPPRDLVQANTVSAGVGVTVSSGAGTPIVDATDPGNSQPHIPGVTNIPFNVNITDPRFKTLGDLTVRLDLLHPNLDQLQITLIPPSGSGLQTVTLLQAQTNTSGTQNQFIGVSGANLGIQVNNNIITADVGTYFDENAARDIVDINPNNPPNRGAAAPFYGRYRPEADLTGGPTLSSYNGATLAQINGTWTIRILDTRSAGTTPPPQFVVNAGLHFQSGGLTVGNAVTAAITQQNMGPIQNTAGTAVPIDTEPVLASDNTLGSFSPYQGRVYLAYVDRIDNGHTPIDNTDIFLMASDNGGRNWSVLNTNLPTNLVPVANPAAVKVNDDLATKDGFSEDNSDLSGTAGVLGNANTQSLTGRPQFQPSLAVDQSTGTLVASWYDTRWTGDRQRPAYYMTTSIDGGQTYSPDVYVNAPRQAIDAVSNTTETLYPMADNFSTVVAGATNTPLTTGFHQGLAVAGGRVYPAWSSNQDATTANDALEDIRVTPTVIADGPRIINSTMGPVGLPGDTINSTRGGDGGPQASAFTVTFDRPVDPATFTPQDVQVFYRDTLQGNPTGGPVPVLSVTPLDSGLFGPAGAAGATKFLVQFAPRSAPGTYSYTVGPQIQDRIRSIQTTVISSGTTSSFTAQPPQVPLPFQDGPLGSPPGLPHTVNSTINATSPPLPTNQVIVNVTVNLTIHYQYSGDLVLTLIAPDGTQVLLANEQPVPFGGLDPTGGYINTTFSDAAAQSIVGMSSPFTGTFSPETPLSQLVGHSPTGTWTLRVDDQFFGVFDSQGTLDNWSLSITTGTVQVNNSAVPGNPMDQNANGTAGQVPGAGPSSSNDVYAAPRPLGGVTTNPSDPTGQTYQILAPFDQNTLPLIVPGPHILTTAAVGPNGEIAQTAGENLALNTTVSGIDVTFDRDMDPSKITSDSVLRIIGPAGMLPATYTDPTNTVHNLFTITPNPLGTDPNPSFPRTYRINFLKPDPLDPTGVGLVPAPQQLSGTYVVTLSPAIQSEQGANLDTNLNAGLDLLKGVATTGQSTPITYNSIDTPAAIPDQKAVSSQITVTDNFVIQGVKLTLNITHQRDPDLEAYLLAPDGVTKIQLFTNIGQTGTQANFNNTVFDDNAGTPIQNGGPPFFGSFQPQEPLGVLKGRLSAGTYTLVVQDDRAGFSGTLNSWSLTLLKPLPASGLGEPVADVATATFRIFTMDPTNPLSSDTWTAVGPAAISNTQKPANNAESGSSGSGRIGGLAVDPSDPSGNTVYVAGASGGVWKTTNFLDPSGPTYIPLTDFGPTFGINIGALAIFARNSDPNQSIVFAATGEGDTGSTGVGFLRSMDGGASWTLLDSTDNTLPFAQRDHLFAKNGGTQSFKLLVDPKLSPTGGVIVYAAISGGNGGVWRSLDTGLHWKQVKQGQATDIVFDPSSGTGGPTGNLTTLYAAFRGDTASGNDASGGVYISTNQGDRFDPMDGGVGDPLSRDVTRNNPVGVANGGISPDQGAGGGRIELAKPALTGNVAQDLIYKGWLYAVVIQPNSHELALYQTKDFGQNWVILHTTTLPNLGLSSGPVVSAIPTNDLPGANGNANVDYDIGGGPPNSGLPAQGNYDISLAVDPTNPNVVYLGGTADGQPTGFIRVDATFVRDAHNLVPYSTDRNDGGALFDNKASVSVGGVTADDPINLPTPVALEPTLNGLVPLSLPSINLIRDPLQPFVGGATYYVLNSAQFVNDGSDVKWTPFDIGGTDQHRIITMVDPLTGHARIIIGDDQGVWTAVDDHGTMSSGIGTAPFADGSRNGNLQITQFYYGAMQPSNAAAQISLDHAFFYGSAQDNGGPFSVATVLTDGNIAWSGPGGDAAGVATDQQGSGTVYQFFWPCCGGNRTDFFQVNGVGRTFGLLQASNPGPTPDPQWPSTFGANFAVNPLQGGEQNGQVIMSSSVGRVFRTENAGRVWSVIAQPGDLDSTYAPALAFGAPDPNAPGGIGNLDNFLYAGTSGGHIFVTQTGGGNGQGNAWINISNGLDGSGVQQIVTNPTRGSHEAYAVTLFGVYHITDSLAPGATWQKINGNGNGNIFSVTHVPFGDPQFTEPEARYLTSMAVDWRYVIPDNPALANGPTHPMLYVGSEAGVYRSIDQGQTWTLFPDQTLNTTPTPPGIGGGLPVAHVTSLSMSLGNIDPTTGRAIQAPGNANMLAATTYGRGTFGIRLAPVVFPNTSSYPNILHLDTTLPPPGGSDSGLFNNDGITNVTAPYIDGLSEQSAFGSTITVNILDLTPLTPGGPLRDPNTAPVIGTTTTDPFGRFQVQVTPGYFKPDGSTDGVKVLGLRAVDQAGTAGNVATLTMTLITLPPPAPAAPDLEPASDSGLSNSDNITNITKPIFDIAGVQPTGIVNLFRDNKLVATITRTKAGPATVSLTDPGPVPQGTHLYKADQVDLAGNVSQFSGTLSVDVITTPPPQPNPPILDPADDSGVQGDDITDVKTPRLDGTAQPGGIIQLIDSAGNLVGQANITSQGTYQVQPGVLLPNGTYQLTPLPDGVYHFRVVDEDVAGNLSAPSAPPLTLTIQTKTPGTPTVMLVPSDDSGTPGDNITNVTRPRLEGTATPGLNVELIDVKGNIVGAGNVITPTGSAAPIIVDNGGNFLIRFPNPLLDGQYTVKARVFDVAGNFADSAPLSLTILTTAPTTTTTLALLPADIYGSSGANVTFLRKPQFIGKATNAGGSPAANTIIDLVNAANGSVLATTTSQANGSFVLSLASDLNNGSIQLEARARDIAGNLGTPSSPLGLTVTTIGSDYFNAGQADLAVYRPTTGTWYVRQPPSIPSPAVLVNTTAPGGIAIQGDFDGDGKIDTGSVNPQSLVWTINRSKLGPLNFGFGQPGVDIPAPADYDGDGVTDFAVYRPTTGQWFILKSSGGAEILNNLGGTPSAGDIPVPADYNGDGKADPAIYHPATAQWFIQQPGGAVQSVVFGQPNVDIPVVADYNGDGKADIAVFRPATAKSPALWLSHLSDGTVMNQPFGGPGDIPVPADYTGDGKADIAVFRPSAAQWLSHLSNGGVLNFQFGQPNVDIPAMAPLRYRMGGVVSTRSGGGSGGGADLRGGSFNFGQSAQALAPPPATTTVLGNGGGSAFAQAMSSRRPAQTAQRPRLVIDTGEHGALSQSSSHDLRAVHETVLAHALDGLGGPGRRRHG